MSKHLKSKLDTEKKVVGKKCDQTNVKTDNSIPRTVSILASGHVLPNVQALRNKTD